MRTSALPPRNYQAPDYQECLTKRCLVTGVSGLIGQHATRALLADGCDVYGVSRTPSFFSSVEAAGQYFPTNLDFSQNWDTHSLPKNVDAVIHLAQSEHFRDFPQSASSIFNVNTASTLKLLDYARENGIKTFILASTGGVYGFSDKPYTEEDEITRGGELGFYSGTKLCSEILAENYTDYLNIIILRFFFVYGPNQRKSMLIPRLVQSVMEGKPIGLQQKDGLRINPTHVLDAVSSIRQALTLSKSHKINIGGPQVLTLRNIGEIIGKVLEKKIIFEEDPNAKPKDLIADIQKMTSLFGAPQVFFEEGIQDYIQQTYMKLSI